MRIGVYIGRWSLTQLGGMGVYLQNLLIGLNILNDQDHEIVLLVDDVNRASTDELVSGARVVELHRPDWSQIPLDERRDVIRVRSLSYKSVDCADTLRESGFSRQADAYLWGLDDAVSHNEIDLLYFTIPPYVKWPTVPVLLTLHDLKHLYRPQDHDDADLARRRRWQRVAQRSALVYASYEHIRRDIEERFGVPKRRTAVLPVACPTGMEKRLPLSEAPALNDEPDKFVLMPAQLWVHKNHKRVVQAVAMLRRRGVDVNVVCTGKTDGQCATCAEEVRSLARSEGVEDLVRLVGYVDQATLRSLYDRARAVLVATLYDPGSFPAIEALAMGKPLVASRVTSIPQTVGEAAILFDAEDARDLSRALERAWVDDDLCRILSEKGPKQLEPRTWTEVASGFLRLCDRAVSEGAQPLPGVGGGWPTSLEVGDSNSSLVRVPHG